MVSAAPVSNCGTVGCAVFAFGQTPVDSQRHKRFGPLPTVVRWRRDVLVCEGSPSQLMEEEITVAVNPVTIARQMKSKASDSLNRSASMALRRCTYFSSTSP
jgi:hypothetical protein